MRRAVLARASIAVLLAWFAAGSGVLAAAQEPARRGRDPVLALQGLLGRLERATLSIQPDTVDEFTRAVGDLRLLWSLAPERGNEIAATLLDLTGHTLVLYDPAGRDDLFPESLRARTAAADVLSQHYDAELGLWLARDVLANASSQPLGRRRAAAWFLIGRRRADQELALLTCTRDADPRLRSIAAEALVGADSEAVHRFFVEEFGRANEPGDPLRMLAERHLRRVRLAPESGAAKGLTKLVRRELLSESWRGASQAIALSRAFDDDAIVPWLIEALGTWKARAEKGLQALRVEHEIEAELELRSGRKLGLFPENWLAWWEAARKGEVKKASAPSYYPEPTRPSFFGLEPRSDRVLFVIDRSGSMEAVFDPAKQSPEKRAATRWEKAATELCGFVEALGPRARFDVVVFHDSADVWKKKLVAADERNLAAARQWLAGQRPLGGTRLRAGIELGLEAAPDGAVAPERVDADTVIVLCDGATAEGDGWVGPRLRRVNPRLRVVFHCVQIGEGGDGTLETLARESGGEFVRITR
ncbi:MAG: VWA domain-containing protein [Planctomycetes bacterium]|nr:VWA domain-containing protein [Planctomycetota bacterium]